MGVEQVRQFLTERGSDVQVMVLECSTATVADAAAAFGVTPGRIAKTLALRLADGRVVIVVAAGDARLDNKKCRHFFTGKVQMLGLDEVEAVTGHPVGGVCPFGLKEDFPIYLDQTLQGYDTVYPAAGATNAAVCMAPQVL
ncbi:MAG: YbaK/EbsC family protein, partial [Rhizomicrobium sp.]